MIRQDQMICAGCGSAIPADESLCAKCLAQLMDNELAWDAEEDADK